MAWWSHDCSRKSPDRYQRTREKSSVVTVPGMKPSKGFKVTKKWCKITVKATTANENEESAAAHFVNMWLKQSYLEKSLCGAITVTCLEKTSLVCLRSVHMAWILGGGLSGRGSQPRLDVVDMGDGALCFLATEAALSERRFRSSKFCYIKEG